MDNAPHTETRIALRYSGRCRICQAELVTGQEAIYEKSTKTVRCVSHSPASAPALPVDVGVPGASARRRFDQLQQKRRERVRRRHPRLGGLILALTDDPHTTSAWSTGAHGEEQIGGRLNELSGEHLLVLHDRRIPRSRANIDHIVICRTGIWVIDTKKYRGRPQLRIEGGIVRPRTEKLMVGSRDRSKLVDGVVKQAQLVSDALVPWKEVSVHPALCFIEADWPLIGGSFTTRGVRVVWPKKLYPELTAEGPVEADRIAEIHAHLAHAFPPA